MTTRARPDNRRAVVVALLFVAFILAPLQILATGPSGSPGPAASPTVDATSDPDPPGTADPTGDEAEPAPTPETHTAAPQATDAPAETPAGETASADPTAPAPSDLPVTDPSRTPEASGDPTPAETPAASAPYVISFPGAAAYAGRADLLAEAGVTETAAIDPLHIVTVDIPVDRAAEILAGLRANPSVLRVESDRERTVEAAPNDVRYPEQWALPVIGWPAVHDAPPADSAVVAVLDTGVAADHPDLAGALLPGVSFVDGVAPDTDPNGHGTWMAGIVGALDDNTEGIAGAGANKLTILPVTVIGPDGNGLDGAIINGIVYAVDHDADVVLMAFASHSYSAALQAAIDYAWEHDVVVVAAVGNDGSAVATYPAGDAGVVGVSATAQDGTVWTSGNSGADVFLAAPGENILTTAADGGYDSISGTSAAAAYAAAAAGLLRAQDAALSNGSIVGRLARTAAAAGDAGTTGNGLLDLGRAWSDSSTDEVKPAGAHGANGGPFVGPYGSPPPAPSATPSTSPSADPSPLPQPSYGPPAPPHDDHPSVYTVAATSWYGTSGWAYRKSITIDDTKVFNDQTNFTILVSLTSDAQLAANAQSTGNDILFTSADGATKLSHQIETYNSATGALIAWVKVPLLYGTVPTTLYMYYGNPGAANQQSSTAAWDSAYTGVYHLANGTTLSLADSTSNVRNGTNVSATATTGNTDGGANLSGTTQYATLPAAVLPAANNFTVSLWFKAATGKTGPLFAEQNAAIGTFPGSWDPMLYIDINGKLEGGIYTGATPAITSAAVVTNSVWHYAVLTVNTTSATQSLYLDGALVGSYAGTPEGPLTTVAVGAGNMGSWPNTPACNASATCYFTGQLDEVRVLNSATIHTANGVLTEWNNQSSPSTFYALGAAEAVDSTPPTVSVTTPAADAVITNGQAITATATDSGSGVDNVEFRYCSGNSCSFASGTSLGTVTTSPYTVTWNSQPTNGTYTIVARATDNQFNIMDSTPVTVTIANSIGSSGLIYDSLASTSLAATTTLSWSHTVGTQANRVLVVGVTAELATSATTCQATTITYNGVAMTKIAQSSVTGSFGGCSSLWYQLAPATGLHTVAATFQGTVDATGGSISFYNVKQAAPDAFNTGSNTVGVTSTSVTTINPNSWVIDVYGSGNAIGDLAPVSPQSAIWIRDVGGTATHSGGMSAKLLAAAGATSMTWTHTGENRSDMVVAAFAPIVDTTPPTTSLSFTEGTTPGGQHEVSTGAHAWTYYYNPTTTGTFTMTVTASDAGSGMDQVEFPTLTTTGFTGTGLVDNAGPYTSNTYTWTSANASAPASQKVNVFDNAGNVAQESVAFVRDVTVPTATSTLSSGPWYTALSVPITLSSSDSQSGVATNQVQRDSATLSNGACGTFPGTWGNVTLSGGADTTVVSGNCYRYRYVVTDNVGNSTTSTQTADAKVDNSAPSTPTLGYSAMTNMSATSNALYYRPAVAGGVTVSASSTDTQSGVASYTFPTLPAGWTIAGSGASRTWTYAANPTAPSGNQNVTATNGAGTASAAAAFTVTADSTAPTGQTVTITGGYYSTLSVPLTLANGSDGGSGLNAASGIVKRASATMSGGVCGTFGGFTTTVTPSGGADTTVVTGNCYRYQYFISDNVGNQSAASANSADAKIDTNAPVAVADSYSVNEDATLSPVAPGVLSNDTDTESGALTALLVTNVANGSLTLNANGSFTYTPTGNFNGSDSFTYKANDGVRDSNTVTVTITVNAVNDVPSFTKGANQSISEDAGAQSVPGWATSISYGPANESTQTLNFIVSNNNNALFSAQPAVSSTGTLTYTPAANTNGVATVSVQIHDNGGTANGGVDTSAVQTFTITVSAVNDAPVNTAPGSQATAVNMSMVFSSGGLNAISIADIDAAASAVQVQLTATNGTLTLSGTTGLSFTVGDGIADATMTFTGTLSAANTALNGLTFSPTNQFTGTATVQIVTNDQGATGSGGALSDTDSVSITVTNTAPTAVADAYTTVQNNALVVAAPGVLSNDTDPNTQTLTVQSPRPVSGPLHGSLTLNADGSFTYTPTTGYSGSDSFTYKATDGIADSAVVTVTLTINTNAYVSASAWPTSFSASRYLDLTFPGYAPAGSIVEGGNFRHTYRSYAGGTTCYYFEVWVSGSLIATHGSSASPVSCNSGTTYVTDTVALPEINTAARANAITVRLFVRNSAGGQSEHATASLGVTYYLGNP